MFCKVVPAAPGAMWTRTSTLKVAPGASGPTLQVTTLAVPEQVAGWSLDTNVAPVGSGSLSTAPVAGLGPKFWIVSSTRTSLLGCVVVSGVNGSFVGPPHLGDPDVGLRLGVDGRRVGVVRRVRVRRVGA